MKLSPVPVTRSLTRSLQSLALIPLLLLLSAAASAQQKKPPAPAPAPKPAPAAKPAPASHPAGGGSSEDPDKAPAGKSNNETGANGRTTTTGASASNRTNPANPANTRTPGATRNTARANANSNNRANASANAKSRPDPNATTIKVITPGAAGSNSSATARTNLSASSGKSGAAAAAKKGPSLNAARANNQPGTHALPNGGTRTVRANGTAVERNKAGKTTAVTTAKGTTVRFDAHGHPAAIHDAHGTTITRGPHGERRVETLRADHSRLVSTGLHAGYAERRFSRDGQEYARRSYFDHGHYYARVYRPYYYAGYPFYSYVPAFYFGPAYYGWAFSAWATPVVYPWVWVGAPWFAPYGYYFSPYPVYPAPAFWLADYAIAASLQAGAEDAGSYSGELQSQPRFVLASAHPGQQQNDAAPAILSAELKDAIARQVKLIIAGEKAAAATLGNLPPDDDAPPQQLPPSLDPRFTLFIAFSSTSLEAADGACVLTAGDIVRRTANTTDADNTVPVEVVSSKKGDCAVGTASRISVDDLEEMHDTFRQKIDDGLKSLADNQGKSGIPTGPAATPHKVPEGQADPDTTVESDLNKQQEAADATEKDVQSVSPDTDAPD